MANVVHAGLKIRHAITEAIQERMWIVVYLNQAHYDEWEDSGPDTNHDDLTSINSSTERLKFEEVRGM